MKKQIILGLVGTALMSSSAFAVKEGGGGAQIESAFRIQGYALISKIANNREANAFCDAGTLQSALDDSDVRIVDKLVDPSSSKPVPANLDAWTVKSDIQLLKGPWQSYFDPKTPVSPKDRSLGALIIHEIYRATGTCDDDHFKITDRVFQLINGGQVVHQNFSEAWSFAYVYRMSKCNDGDDRDDYWCISQAAPNVEGDFYICENPLPLAANSRTSCMQITNWTTSTISRDVFFMDGPDPYGHQILGYEIARLSQMGCRSNVAFNSGAVLTPDYVNSIPFISPQHPLVVVHDIRNGTWSGSIQ